MKEKERDRETKVCVCVFSLCLSSTNSLRQAQRQLFEGVLSYLSLVAKYRMKLTVISYTSKEISR